ncbi:low temperature requirement protein A [Nocardia sp. NPDC003482]
MSSAVSDEAEGGQTRASTLELFFDLVFVFALTQLTHAFGAHPGWPALGRVALVFAIMWWMYSGYVWLTNEVAPNSTVRRTALMLGMFGFFVIALAIPGAFAGSGIAFGLGYLLVNVVHSALFWANGGTQASAAALRIVPPNAVSAILVLVGGCVHGWPRYGCWIVALVVQIATPYLSDPGGFVIRTAHFCERHGLVLLVALGESVVAVGASLHADTVTVPLVAMVGLGLTLSYVLWWAYFGLDDERGEHALAALAGPRRGRPAVLAYGYALYPMLLGVILTAAGIGTVLAHGNSPVPVAQALALSGGVALYFFGQGCFRLALGIPRAWIRLVAALAVLATAPIGVAWVAWGQLVALLVVGYGLVIADDNLGIRAGDHSAYV